MSLYVQDVNANTTLSKSSFTKKSKQDIHNDKIDRNMRREGGKKVTLLRNFGKRGYWNRISKKLIIPITPGPIQYLICMRMKCFPNLSN